MSKNILSFLDDFLEITTNYSIKKTKLAFGYGYDPNILKEGIKEFEYSHDISPKIKLYTFSPRISYKIFPKLAKLMRYEQRMSNILIKGNTEIKNDYFTTDQDPNSVVQDLNNGLELIFVIYDPVPYKKSLPRRLTAKNIAEVMDYMVSSHYFQSYYDVLTNNNFHQLSEEKNKTIEECKQILVDVAKIEGEEDEITKQKIMEKATDELIQEKLNEVYNNIIVDATGSEFRFLIHIKKTKAEIKAEQEQLKEDLIVAVAQSIHYKIRWKEVSEDADIDKIIFGIIEDKISKNVWQGGSYKSLVDELFDFITDDIKKEIVIESKKTLKLLFEKDIDKFLKPDYEKVIDNLTHNLFSENYNKIKAFTLDHLKKGWDSLIKESDPVKQGLKYKDLETDINKAKREINKNKFSFIEFNTRHTDLLYDHLDTKEKKEFLSLFNLNKEIDTKTEWKLFEVHQQDQIKNAIKFFKEVTAHFHGRYSEKLDKLLYDIPLIDHWITLLSTSKYELNKYQTVMQNVFNHNPTLLKTFELDLIDKTQELDLKARLVKSGTSQWDIRNSEKRLKQLKLYPNFFVFEWGNLPKEIQDEIIIYLEIISRLFTLKGKEILPEIESLFKSMKSERKEELLERKTELITHLTQLDNTSLQSIFLEKTNKKQKIEEFGEDYDTLIKLSKDLLTFEILKDPSKYKDDISFIKKLINKLEEKLSNRIINCSISKPIQQALYYFSKFINSFSKKLTISIKKDLIRFIGKSKVMISYMDFNFPATTDAINIFKEKEISFNCEDFINFITLVSSKKVKYNFSLIIFDSYAKILRTRPNFPLFQKRLDTEIKKKDANEISSVISKMQSFSYENYLKINSKQLQLFYKDFSKSKIGKSLADKTDYYVEIKSLSNGISLVKKSDKANYFNKKLLDFSEFKEQKISNDFNLLFPIGFFISTFGGEDSIIKLLKESDHLTLWCETENPLKIALEIKIDKDSSISLNYFLSPSKIKVTSDQYQNLLLESLNSYDRIKTDLNKIVKTTHFNNKKLISNKKELEQSIKNNLQDYVVYNQKSKQYNFTAETLSYLDELTSLEIKKERENVQNIINLIGYFKNFKKYFNNYEKMVVICDYKNYNKKGKNLIKIQIKKSENKIKLINKKIETLKNNHKVKHNLEKKTIKELKVLAKTKYLTILSKLRKDEIIDKITNSYDDVIKQMRERGGLNSLISQLNSNLQSYDRLPEYKRKTQNFIDQKDSWYSTPSINDLLSLIGIGSKKELFDPYYHFILLRIKIESSVNLQNKKQIAMHLTEIDKIFQEVGRIWQFSNEDKITPLLNKMISLVKKLETIDKKLVLNIIKGIKKYIKKLKEE